MLPFLVNEDVYIYIRELESYRDSLSQLHIYVCICVSVTFRLATKISRLGLGLKLELWLRLKLVLCIVVLAFLRLTPVTSSRRRGTVRHLTRPSTECS